MALTASSSASGRRAGSRPRSRASPRARNTVDAVVRSARSSNAKLKRRRAGRRATRRRAPACRRRSTPSADARRRRPAAPPRARRVSAGARAPRRRRPGAGGSRGDVVPLAAHRRSSTPCRRRPRAAPAPCARRRCPWRRGWRLVGVGLEVVQLVLRRRLAVRVEVDGVLPAAVAHAADPVRLARRLLERRPRLVVVVGEQDRVADAVALAAQHRPEVVRRRARRARPARPARPSSVGTTSTSETSASLWRGDGKSAGLDTTSGTWIDSS